MKDKLKQAAVAAAIAFIGAILGGAVAPGTIAEIVHKIFG